MTKQSKASTYGKGLRYLKNREMQIKNNRFIKPKRKGYKHKMKGNHPTKRRKKKKQRRNIESPVK